MNLIKYSYLFLFFITLLSCKSKSIISNNQKYFYENNSFKNKNSNLILTQKIELNNVKNGLHNSIHKLTIEFKNTSNLKKNQLLYVNSEKKVKIKYQFNSNRVFEINSKKITGTIKILELTDTEIKLDEKLCVSLKNKKINFNGIRVFKKNTDTILRMKRNRNRIKHQICKNDLNKKLDISYILRVLPDNGWVLKLKKNGRYKYFHWSGWGKPETLEKGKYFIQNGIVTLKSNNGKELIPRKYILKIVQNKRNDDCINCTEKGNLTYCLYKYNDNNGT